LEPGADPRHRAPDRALARTGIEQLLDRVPLGERESGDQGGARDVVEKEVDGVSVRADVEVLGEPGTEATAATGPHEAL
jgi:hypothetical protein